MRLPLAIGLALAAASLAGCASSRTLSKEALLARGNSAVALHHDAEALIDYRTALQKDPAYGEAHHQLGLLFLRRNDGLHALQSLVRAADLLPANDDVQLLAGQLLLAAGRFEEASTRAAAVLARSPARSEAYVLKGNAMVGLKDLPAALHDIEAAIAISPGASSYAVLGWMHLAQGKRDEAARAFDRAVAVEPASVVARLAHANFLLAAGRAEDAGPEFAKAAALDPSNVTAQRALATYFLSTGREAEAEAPLAALAALTRTVEARLALADLTVRRKRLPEARALLTALAEEPAGFAAAGVRLAAIDAATGHRPEAHQRLDAVLRQEPGQADGLMLKARLLMQEAKPDLALAQAAAAVAAAPASVAARYLLGEVHLSRHETAAAVADFTEVLRLNPRALGAQLQLVKLASASAASAPGAQHLAEDLVRKAPGNPNARLALVRVWLAQRQFVPAAKELAALAGTHPDSPDVAVLAGTLALLRNNGVEARRAFDRALQLAPDSADAVRGRVVVDLVERKHAEARALVDGAVAQHPASGALLMVAAATYGTLGDLPAQEALLKRVVAVDPGNTQAFTSLAGVYARQRRLPEGEAGARDGADDEAGQQAVGP